jgi:serine/threonine-protein phosphatase 5
MSTEQDSSASSDAPSLTSTTATPEEQAEEDAEMETADQLPPVHMLIDHSSNEHAEAKSLELKQQGNDALVAGKFLEAIKFYSEALEYAPTSAIILSNRAQAYIKTENYGLAILDASAAIEHDAAYAKGYYRRGSAHFALSKYKAARKDFRQVCKLKPKDRDARAKLAECEKAVREEAFRKAIESEETIPLSETYDPNTLSIETKYDGPHPLADAALSNMEEEAALFQPGKLPMDFVLVRCGISDSCLLLD